MSDDQTPPSKPAERPANVNRQAQVRATRQRPERRPASRESKFIGYIVLGFGVIAVMAVLLLAFSMRGDKTQAVTKTPVKEMPKPVQQQIVLPPANTELTKRASEGLFGDFLTSDNLKPRTSKTDQEEGLFFPRQQDFSANEADGSWQAPIGNYAAALEMKKGVFQLIMADPNDYGRRLYSAGTYSVTEDIIQLVPRKDWPPPKPPEKSGIYYMRITNASFPVIASMQKGKMVWQKPPASEKRVRQIRSIPFTMSTNQQYIVWQPVKN